MIVITALGIAALIAAYFFTGLFRSYALKVRLLDVPNDRSSHSTPTPRGGGLAIVITFYVAVLAAGLLNLVNMSMLYTLLLSGGLVSLVGYLDDHSHIPARIRLIVHFLASSVVLYFVPLPDMIFFGYRLEFGGIFYVIIAIYLVWLLNLYNFMDGIDGLASIQALSVCLAIGIILVASQQQELSEVLGLLIFMGMAVAGFLIWNFPPAKIFMGDIGSSFIGFMIGVFSLLSAQKDMTLFWSWLIMMGVFIVDASFTLVARVLMGYKFYEAHRTHAYQHAALKFSHLKVTVSVAIINLFWLLPISFLVVFHRVPGELAIVIAYTPLVVTALILRAGKNHSLKTNGVSE